MDEWLRRMIALRDALREPDFRRSFEADVAGTLRDMGLPVRDATQYMVSTNTPDGVPFVSVDLNSLSDSGMSTGTFSHDGDHHYTDCLGH